MELPRLSDIDKKFLNSPFDKEGNTVLSVLLKNNTLSESELLKLLDLKPDVNIKNKYGNTPMSEAFKNNDITEKVLLKLLDLKPNLNIQNVTHYTPLIHAFTNPHITEKVLLKILDLKPKFNDNSLYYAFSSRSKNITEKVILKILDLKPKLPQEIEELHRNVTEKVLRKMYNLRSDLILPEFSMMNLLPYNITKLQPRTEGKNYIIDWIETYVEGNYTPDNKLLHHIPIEVGDYLKSTIKDKIYKLYRGYSFTTRKAFSRWFDEEVYQFSNFTKGSKVTLRPKMITSWSYNKSVSERFLDSEFDKTLISVLFYAEFKKASVFGDISAFNKDQEVLIKPSTIKCTLMKILNNGVEVELLYDIN